MSLRELAATLPQDVMESAKAVIQYCYQVEQVRLIRYNSSFRGLNLRLDWNINRKGLIFRLKPLVKCTDGCRRADRPGVVSGFMIFFFA